MKTFRRFLLGTLAILIIGFLILPIVIVIPFSFIQGTVLTLPPHAFSLEWYRAFVNDPTWREAAWVSIRLAVSVALIATVVGLITSLALTRTRIPGKSLLRGLILLPLIVPSIITGIALLTLYYNIGLIYTFQGLLIADTVLAIPYAVLIIESRMRRIDPSLEDAASSLGASRLRAFRRVTVPLIAPALFGSMLFSFYTSWEEVVVTSFLAGVNTTTLPLKMFETVQNEVSPTVAAVSTIMIFLAAVSATSVMLVGRWRRNAKTRGAFSESTLVGAKPVAGARAPVPVGGGDV